MKKILGPHTRFNPLTEQWITVSAHRLQRPWLGASEKVSPPKSKQLSYDSSCYLCPKNQRLSGAQNADYKGPWVFQNDFQALITNEQKIEIDDDLFKAKTEDGECKVICYSDNHSLTMADMNQKQIQDIIWIWIQQYHTLSQKYGWVQIFENKGELMGCSNPHPHGQIWASESLPQIAQREDHSQLKYFQQHSKAMLMSYLTRELESQQRVVIENNNWCVLVPYWATWPFETLLLPKFEIHHLSELQKNPDAQLDLALILKQLTKTYDNLFNCSFPYSMGWHGTNKEHWTLHAHFYPPLLRSASIKKHMVGYELLAQAQRDLTPEQAAQKLRENLYQYSL